MRDLVRYLVLLRLASPKRFEIAKMYLLGASPSHIARELGVDKSLVKGVTNRLRGAKPRDVDRVLRTIEASIEPVARRVDGSYVCGLCGARFASEGALIRHVSTHRFVNDVAERILVCVGRAEARR